MIVYDITDRESFDGLRFWLQEIDKYLILHSGMQAKMSINSLWEINRTRVRRGKSLSTKPIK